MADVSKLKSGSRSTLGPPPAPDDARDDLQVPPAAPATRIDMRMMRRTNRTVQFSTRITAELDERIRQIAFREQLMLTELLERAVDAYERSRMP